MHTTRYDDIFSWDGWGGKLKLTSGRCRLRIYDLQPSDKQGPVFLKPVIVVVSDLPESYGTHSVVSVRSCAGHIATRLIQKFGINPERMLYVEYHPQRTYGQGRTRIIPERYEAVDFKWTDNKAFAVQWRVLDTRTKEQVIRLMKGD